MFQAEKREIAAEFLGTFVLIIFGIGVNAQVSLGGSSFGSWLSINLGWGLAVTMGVYVAGGITGAHLNPAVTLALAARNRLQWSKVLPYVSAQLVGAFVASAVVYLVYTESINSFESTLEFDGKHAIETASIWGTYPQKFANGSTLSILGGLVDQIVGTALLLMCIFALCDKRNLAPSANIGPVVVGSVVLLIGMTFGSNCGYAINPARDFSPRLFTFFAGWGSQVFAAGNYFWWVPIVGPCIGGVLGGFLYDLLIENLHPEKTVED